MFGDRSWERARSLLLFIMLVMCTLPHGHSVAHVYVPALGKVLSVIGVSAK